MSVVLFLSGRTMGDALGATGRTLKGLFEEFGHEFVEINFGENDAVDRLNQTITTRPIECALSHVGMGADFMGQTQDERQFNLWTANRIPFISFFGDSPAYFFDRHVVSGWNFACLYAFPEHYELRKRLPHCRGILGITPVRPIDETTKAQIDFRAKESGKLLFLKNGNDPERLVRMWRESLPPRIFEILAELGGELVGGMQKEQGCDIDSLVCAYFRNKGVDIDEMTNLRLLFVAQLDDYLRRVKSTLMAEALREFPVQIHGYNWEHVDFSGGRAEYVYGADYAASKDLIKEALGIIDMSPNTSRNPHDRALRAYGLYTLCLTNEQAFFAQHFARHQDFTFRFEKESLQSKVADVLTNPKRFVELGLEVADSFRKRFDALAFVQTLLEISACLRLGAGPRPPNMQDYFAWPPEKLS
jgi:hypothetical protein